MNCLVKSLAAITEFSVPEIMAELGHDGSEIIWHDLPEPYCRRGFHIQELITFCLKFGYTLTPIEPIPACINKLTSKPFVLKDREAIFEATLPGNIGILTGETLKGISHAVAWDGHKIYDSNKQITSLDDFKIQCFWMLNRIISL